MKFKRQLAVLLSICMVFSMLAPVTVRAEGADGTGASVTLPTSIEKATFTVQAEQWPEGESRPADLTITTANLFESGNRFAFMTEDLPDTNGRWYVQIEGDSYPHSLRVDESGVAFNSDHYFASDAAGEQSITLTIRDNYNADDATFVYGPVTLTTCCAAGADMPALTQAEINAEKSPQVYTFPGSDSSYVSCYLMNDFPSDLSPIIRAVTKDGAVLAGSDLGYTAGEAASRYSTHIKDPRYRAIFGDRGNYTVECVGVNGTVYSVAKLEPGNYDLVLQNAEGDELARFTDAFTVTALPIVGGIYLYRMRGDGRQAEIQLELHNANPAEFSVSVYDGEKLLGASTPGAYRVKDVYYERIDATYTVPLTAAKVDGRYTVKVATTHDAGFVGVSEESVFFNTTSGAAGLVLDSKFYADVLIRLGTGVDRTAVYTAALLDENNNQLATGTLHSDANGLAEVAFTGADGSPIRLAADRAYRLAVYFRSGSPWTQPFYLNERVRGYSGSAVVSTPNAGTVTSAASRALFAAATKVDLQYGDLYQQTDGDLRAQVDFYESDTSGFADMKDAGSYKLELTNRLGVSYFLTGASVKEKWFNSGEIHRSIVFALPSESELPNGYYSAKLYYDDVELTDQNGENLLGSYADTLRLSRFPRVWNITTPHYGLYLNTALNGTNLPSNGTVSAELFRYDNTGSTPDLKLGLAENGLTLDMSQLASGQLRERYNALYKIDGIPVVSYDENDPRYFAPEDALLHDETASYTVTAGSSTADFDLISCPGGETVASGSQLAAYTEVFVHVKNVPDGFYVTPNGVKVNGEPILGRAFLLREDSVVTVEPTELPTVYYNATVDTYTPGGSVTLSAESLAAGETLTITPTPDARYRVASVRYRLAGTQNYIDLPKNEDGLYTLIMPASDIEVTAGFRQMPTLTVYNGNIHPSDPGTVTLYKNGDPLSDVYCYDLYPGDVISVALNACTATRLYAQFSGSATVYELTEGADGRWTLPITEAMYDENGTVFYLYAENLSTVRSNYVVLDATVHYFADGTYYGVGSIDGYGELYLTDVDGNAILDAYSSGGKARSGYYNTGDTVYFRVNVTDPNYYLESVTCSHGIEPAKLGDGWYSFAAIDANGEDIRPHVEVRQYEMYDVSTSADMYGSIAMSAYSARAGETVTVTVNPDDGFRLDTLSVTATALGTAITYDCVASNVYSFIMPASPVTVNATFRDDVALAPGGTVTDAASLVTALGGDSYAALRSDAGGEYVELLQNIELEDTLNVTGGSLRIKQYGVYCTLTAPAGKSAVEVSGGSLRLSGNVSINGISRSGGSQVLSVSGGSLTLEGNVSVHADSADPYHCDAVRVTAGTLTLAGTLRDRWACPNLNVGGGGDGICITGGSAVIYDCSLWGGYDTGAASDTTAPYGCGVHITGGSLTVYGGSITKGGGSALYVENSPAVLLCGGGFNSNYWDGTSNKPAPTVCLPTGMTLESILGEGCTLAEGETIAINSAFYPNLKMTREDALRASEVDGAFTVQSESPLYQIASYGEGNGYTVAFDGLEAPMAAAGKTVRFTASAAEGYEISNVGVFAAASGAIELTFDEKDGYSFVMPSEDVTISVGWSTIKYPAPGGTVTDAASLAAALGGAENVRIEESGTIVLLRDVQLQSPLKFTDGRVTLSADVYRQLIGPQEGAIIVDGGTLRLEDNLSVRAEEGTAVMLRSGRLELGRNNNAMQPMIVGGSGHHALEITGGEAWVEEANLMGGQAVYSNDANNTNATGGTATGGGKTDGTQVAPAGNAVHITDGKLTVTGGRFNPGYPDGSALAAEGEPEIVLRGGYFRGVTSETEEKDENGHPIWKVTVPSVKLPAGMTLSNIVDTGYGVTVDGNSSMTVEQALASNEPLANLTVYAQESYAITLIDSPNGSIRVEGGVISAPAGSIVRLFITPNAGYELDNVWMKYSDKDGVWYDSNILPDADGVYSFTMPAGEVQISANFPEAKVAAPGGTVTDAASLVTALGGAENVRIEESGTIVLLRDVRLQSPLEFTGGRVTLSVDVNRQLIGPQEGAIIVDGGTLRLEGNLSVRAKEGTAVMLRSGRLELGRNNNAMQPKIEGGNGHHALEITGGEAWVEEANLMGGQAVYSNDANNTNAAGGTATGGGKTDGTQVAPAGNAVHITDGKLTVTGGWFYPGYPDGSALAAEGAPEIVLRGGYFRGLTSETEEKDENGNPIWKVTVPSVKLPAGMTLSNIVDTGYGVTVNGNSSMTVEQALAASDVMANIQVVVDETGTSPIMKVRDSTLQTASVGIARLTVDAVLIASLHDAQTGRLLTVGTADVKAGSTAETVEFQSVSAERAILRLFLCERDTLKPILEKEERIVTR